MHTFLTPEPITVEIRNAAGEIRVDLADVASTTVDVTTSSSHPLGFLDDIFRAVASKGAQFAGDRKVFAGGRGQRFDSSGFGDGSSANPEDPADRARVDLKQPVDGVGAATLIVDTDPARDGWKSSFTVHVTAPRNSGIRIQTQSADVSVIGVAERFETRTASGDVAVDTVLGRSVVQTASGDVTITSTGDCDLRTASGDIRVQSVGSTGLVHSTSGGIEIGVSIGDVSARTVSGEIQVRDAGAGQVELTTVSGDVEVGIHAGTLTAVDLRTVSGHTESDFQVSDEMPASDTPVPAEPAAEVSPEEAVLAAAAEAMVGDATATAAPESDPTVGLETPQAPADDAQPGLEPVLDLRVKTTSGDIRIKRAALI